MSDMDKPLTRYRNVNLLVTGIHHYPDDVLRMIQALVGVKLSIQALNAAHDVVACLDKDKIPNLNDLSEAWAEYPTLRLFSDAIKTNILNYNIDVSG